MTVYDAIVVGAGPAGSAAARTLAMRGGRVLLVERFPLPRNKSCSGILIRRSMERVRSYFGEEVPDFTTCEPVENRGMIFTDDRGKEYRFEQEGRNIWRSSFDGWLASMAKEGGAELRDGVSVLSCEEKSGYVLVNLRGRGACCTEQARFVLDCEGVTGSVKRKIRNRTPAVITTFQTFCRGFADLDPHYFYAYLQPELSEYDAWFNVKDDFLILGVSVRDTQRISHFYERFLDYMRAHHRLRIDQQVKSEKWLMPHIQPGCPIDYGEGRVLFAGEAAGFLNPMGEGISAAMESGYYAACAVAEKGENLKEVYTDYRRNTEALRDYMERQWRFVAGMAGTFQEMGAAPG